jgi:hypothetical protein
MTRFEHRIAIGRPIGSEFVLTMRFRGRWVELTTWRVTEHEPSVRPTAEAGAESS